jgi:uncharacterized protein YraI
VLNSLMRDTLLILACSLIVTALSSAAYADPINRGGEHCVVAVRPDDPLNLRAGPGSAHATVSQLPYASCGVIVTDDCAASWCPVNAGHYAGWVHRRYIAAVSRKKICLAPARASGPVSIRAWPALSSRPLTTLSPRTCDITMLPYSVAGWQKIRSGGWEGWVQQADLSLSYR